MMTLRRPQARVLPTHAMMHLETGPDAVAVHESPFKKVLQRPFRSFVKVPQFRPGLRKPRFGRHPFQHPRAQVSVLMPILEDVRLDDFGVPRVRQEDLWHDVDSYGAVTRKDDHHADLGLAVAQSVGAFFAVSGGVIFGFSTAMSTPGPYVQGMRALAANATCDASAQACRVRVEGDNVGLKEAMQLFGSLMVFGMGLPLMVMAMVVRRQNKQQRDVNISMSGIDWDED